MKRQTLVAYSPESSERAQNRITLAYMESNEKEANQSLTDRIAGFFKSRLSKADLKTVLFNMDPVNADVHKALRDSGGLKKVVLNSLKTVYTDDEAKLRQLTGEEESNQAA